MFVFHIAWNDKARSAILKMFKKKAHRTHFGKVGPFLLNIVKFMKKCVALSEY